jgi:hypothetical protein
LQLALTGGKARRAISEGLGIGVLTLTRWLGQDRNVSLIGNFALPYGSAFQTTSRRMSSCAQRKSGLVTLHGRDRGRRECPKWAGTRRLVIGCDAQ